MRTVVLLAVMAALVPAVGSPGPELLQDSLKSMGVAFFALGAALHFVLTHRRSDAPLRWHPVLWGPLALMAWALGSMAWSHTYLGGVEAIRWALFALLVWLGLQAFTRERLFILAWGVHAGAVLASLWAALQFWLDWRFFSQGPPPASTFINRNFFAEYTVCALPFSVWLLARSRGPREITALSASLGLVVVALFMTGTRSALVALGALLLVAGPLALWRCRQPSGRGHRLGADGWRPGSLALAAGVVGLVIATLGNLPTGNVRIAQEARGLTPIARALNRGQSIGPADPSLGLRQAMWRSTWAMVLDHPLAGVGAGAWEVHVPRYQPPGSQLETDYYAHNEFLQLLAEYGVVGAGVLLAGLAWLLRAAWRTLADRSAAMDAWAPQRWVALSSLLALAIVSLAGFAWRMAATGALFALALALLAASQATPVAPGRRRAAVRALAVTALVAAFGLATFISVQAVRCESRLVRATELALEISAAGHGGDEGWRAARQEVVRLAREGIAINSHYRKITPQVADELAAWGQWADATWIWESVLQSRPHIVAILTNAARGHAALGEEAIAWERLAQARAVQPDAVSVRSLEVVLLARSGQVALARERARSALEAGLVDPDLVRLGLALGRQAGDAALVELAWRRTPAPWRAALEAQGPGATP